ncbi:Protein RADIALIS-like 6 [Bienertia sinuspersici]
MNYSNSSSSNEEWTSSENKQFENALAELDLTSPNLYENINAIMPWKTIEQIKNHYEKLIDDVLMIERGDVSSPNYGDTVVDASEVDHRQRRGAPWTDEEHR